VGAGGPSREAPSPICGIIHRGSLCPAGDWPALSAVPAFAYGDWLAPHAVRGLAPG